MCCDRILFLQQYSCESLTYLLPGSFIYFQNDTFILANNEDNISARPEENCPYSVIPKRYSYHDISMIEDQCWLFRPKNLILFQLI